MKKHHAKKIADIPIQDSNLNEKQSCQVLFGSNISPFGSLVPEWCFDGQQTFLFGPFPVGPDMVYCHLSKWQMYFQ